MLREKIVTIVIGLLVGALVAGGLFFGPGLLTKLQGTHQQAANQPTSTKPASITKKVAKVTFELTSPENNSSTTDTTIKVKGTATPATKITIFGNADEQQVVSDKSGNFEADFKLEEGENELTITQHSDPLESLYRNVTLEISK